MKTVFETVSFGEKKKIIEQDGKWYVMIAGVGRIGPFESKEEAEKEMNS